MFLFFCMFCVYSFSLFFLQHPKASVHALFTNRLFHLGLSPRLTVLSHKADKGVNLSRGDVLLKQLAVVVEERRDCVFGQHVVANLLLHEPELLGDVLLQQQKKKKSAQCKTKPMLLRIDQCASQVCQHQISGTVSCHGPSRSRQC